jgi:hypothetical protein
MGLEKAIAYKKEQRRPFRGSKAFDSSCRNHGGCPWCEGNRLRSQRRAQLAAKLEAMEAQWPQNLPT